MFAGVVISGEMVGRDQKWKRGLTFILHHPLRVQAFCKTTSFNCDNNPAGK